MVFIFYFYTIYGLFSNKKGGNRINFVIKVTIFNIN